MRLLDRSLPLLAALCVSTSIARADGHCDGIETFDDDSIALELVSGALASPVDVTAPPGDTSPGDRGRLFVVEQGGRIRIIDLADDTLNAAPFLDIATLIRPGGERGLLGLAFHPNYAENGYFYVNYTRRAGAVCAESPPLGCLGNRDSETVIARYQVSAEDPNRADRDSELVVLSFCQPFGNHNAGQLAFGPDGYLYIATGDGGSGGDPCNSGQTALSLLGKLLRIDVDNAPPDAAYSIPDDNPFVDDPNVRPEIWSLGLRNPWRFSFDAETGDLYIADVGQNAREEIDFEVAGSSGGANYGWRRLEGDGTFSGGTALGPGELTGPIYDYTHGGGAFRGCSVTGGVVYRGCRIPSLHGAYFLADYCNDWIGTFRVEDGAVTELQDRTADLNRGISPRRATAVSSFGTDAQGEVYVCSMPSSLYRIVHESTVNYRPTATIATDPDPADLVLENGRAVVVLDGSASDDGDGGEQGLTFEWEQTSGPDSVIASPDEAITEVEFVEPGRYRYRLTVNDGELSAIDRVTVDVEDGAPRFIRGDANVDGIVDISDGVRVLGFLFLFLPDGLVTCNAALDTDDSGTVNITDGIYVLNFLFLGGPHPAPPFPTCGVEPEPTDCVKYPHCE